jgi:hypothetical protein
MKDNKQRLFEIMQKVNPDFKINENIEEGWGQNLAAGALMTAATLGGGGVAHAQSPYVPIKDKIENVTSGGYQVGTPITTYNDYIKVLKKLKKQGFMEMGNMEIFLPERTLDKGMTLNTVTASARSTNVAETMANQKIRNAKSQDRVTLQRRVGDVTEVITFYGQ